MLVENVPAIQFKQTDDDPAPISVEYCPAEHAMQALVTLAPDVTE